MKTLVELTRLVELTQNSPSFPPLPPMKKRRLPVPVRYPNALAGIRDALAAIAAGADIDGIAILAAHSPVSCGRLHRGRDTVSRRDNRRRRRLHGRRVAEGDSVPVGADISACCHLCGDPDIIGGAELK